jgi:hypothetical protein
MSNGRQSQTSPYKIPSSPLARSLAYCTMGEEISLETDTRSITIADAVR